MFKNHFLLALRTIRRNRIFTLINIVGLSIGITAAIVIYLLVRHDYSFDKFHRDGKHIYRVVSQFEFSGEKTYNSGVPVPLTKLLPQKVPGVQLAAPFYTLSSNTEIKVRGNNTIAHRNQSNTIYASPDYFQLLNYEWIAGSPLEALSKPQQVVLSESKAQLYFPGQHPAQIIGQQITINDSIDCTITGLVKPLNGNTDFTFQVFISLPTLKTPADLLDWNSTSSASQLLVKLDQSQNVKTIEYRLKLLFVKNAPPDPYNKLLVPPFVLQPLKDIHFDSRFGTYFDNRVANKTTLHTLIVIGIFMLLLGCINFVNLSTAQSAERAKEIGIRKTLGGSKRQLIIQFLVQTFILTTIAALLSIFITLPTLRLLKDFVPAEIIFDPLRPALLWLFLSVLIIVVTLLAGFYPAWIVSAYKPVQALKNSFNSIEHTGSGLSIRRVLIVSQFVVAQFFIIAVITVSMQLRYALQKDPGFTRDGIVHFQTDYNDTVVSKIKLLGENIKKIAGVRLVSISNNPVAGEGIWSAIIKYHGGNKQVETNVQMKMADTNYIKIYGLKLLAGRNLRESDTIKEFIVNEAYAKLLGWNLPEQAIGKTLDWNGRKIPVTGVVANFHQQSLHHTIKPLVICSSAENQKTINVALANGARWPATIEQIGKLFKSVYPNADFEYSFQSDTIKKYYDNERKTEFLVKCASVLTIIISCLGLLGLAIYSTVRRTKEIGIRKVLGASALQIVKLISWESVALVAIAFVIAAPVAYYFIYVWLKNFAFHISVSWWMFALTFILQLLLALCTVGSQALRAAMINPANTLKAE